NEIQSRSLIVTDTELQKLVRQGLIVNEIHKLKNQYDDSREKVYHSLMRELFSMKAFRDVFSQDGLFSEAEYYRNKIDNHITDFIIQMEKERVMDLLNDAENKDSEMHEQIIIF
ncbi:3458_t:CDS:2, partial [Funneliformis mosseae]